jgi:hypothetical protein
MPTSTRSPRCDRRRRRRRVDQLHAADDAARTGRSGAARCRRRRRRRILFVAADGDGIVGTVQLVVEQPERPRIAPTSRR